MAKNRERGNYVRTESRWKYLGEDGQSLVECALIILLIAVVAVIGLTAFGGGVATLYGTIVSSF
jgi:Flp pilus assembly pilin Flp